MKRLYAADIDQASSPLVFHRSRYRRLENETFDVCQ